MRLALLGCLLVLATFVAGARRPSTFDASQETQTVPLQDVLGVEFVQSQSIRTLADVNNPAIASDPGVQPHLSFLLKAFVMCAEAPATSPKPGLQILLGTTPATLLSQISRQSTFWQGANDSILQGTR